MSVAGLDWISNRDAYGAMLHEAGRSNLLQSWAWGEAKAETEGWCPRRAVLSVGSVALAAVQILEKRLGPAKILRINRGPVWLYDDLTAEAKQAVLVRLRNLGRWYKGRALLMAPEMPEGSMPGGLGLRPRSAPIWRSAWVDLRRPEDEIRKSLNGKWRNMLVNAEKAGLDVDIVADTQGLDYLLPRYGAMMADKGFAATPPPLLSALARHGDAGDLTTLIARHQGEDASAVLIARHGAAATYLVGWNCEAGRRLRGNYLLLWQALLAAKDQGVRWLDVGGIDAQATPGVATFKRGLNGQEYALAGEWLAI